jgi:hypothetical protein
MPMDKGSLESLRLYAVCHGAGISNLPMKKNNDQNGDVLFARIIYRNVKYAMKTAARLVKILITPKVMAAERSGDTRDVSAMIITGRTRPKSVENKGLEYKLI